MTGELPQDPPQGQLLIYQDGSLNLQVRLDGQTVWLPQRLIAELFQVSVKTANEHLVNIYSEGEIGREATVRSFRIVQREGSRDVARQVEHYSLDAIFAVGYRVRSARGTAFRQWATARLSELLFYQKITDIYATTSTTTRHTPSARPSSPPCGTSCTGPFTATPLPRSSNGAPTLASPTWV